MNVQRIPEYLLRWGATLGGIVLALYMAKALGDGQGGRVALILAGIGAMMLTFTVRDKLWVAIPIMWSLSGRIPSLDVPFALRDLVVMFVFAAFLSLKAFKVVLRQPKPQLVDLVCILMLLYLISAFIRNPVGVEAFGAEKVGGRPYFNVFIGALAYWVLARSTMSLRAGNRLAIATTCGRMAEGVAAIFLNLFPSSAFFFAAFYTSTFFSWISGLDDTRPLVEPGAETTGRLGYLVIVGGPLLAYLAARYPMNAFFNPLRPWRMLLLLVGVGCILFSGFRSAIVVYVLIFLIAGYLRNGFREVMKMGAIIGICVATLALGNRTFFELPRSVQRGLSWLPGDWDEFAVLEARDSTRWRVEMWYQMLTTNRYIESRLFGDGFGFTKRDLDQMHFFRKYGDYGANQENFMISGNVHSGPISTIRVVGYAGLAIYLFLLCLISREAWKIIRRGYATPFRLLTFMVCIPTALEPFVFIFIFGAFDISFPDALFALGMVKMLGNSLDDYEARTPTVAESLPELNGPSPDSLSSVPALPCRPAPDQRRW